MNETKFKNWLRSSYIGWSCSFGPGVGGEAGTPDVMLLGKDSTALFLELKIGKVSDDMLWLSEIRPVQFQWMWKFQRAGGAGSFLVGVYQKGVWRCYLLPMMTPSAFERLSRTHQIPVARCFVFTKPTLESYEFVDKTKNWLSVLTIKTSSLNNS